MREDLVKMCEAPRSVEEFIANNKQWMIMLDNSHGVEVLQVDRLLEWMAGHARVVMEPTDKMIDAAIDTGRADEDEARHCWNSMLSAFLSAQSDKEQTA